MWMCLAFGLEVAGVQVSGIQLEGAQLRCGGRRCTGGCQVPHQPLRCFREWLYWLAHLACHTFRLQ
jgi:hypothetical protein